MFKHLQEARKTYWIHFWFAIKASFWLLLALFTSLVHAFVPGWFPFVARNIIIKLNRDIENLTRNDS